MLSDWNNLLGCRQRSFPNKSFESINSSLKAFSKEVLGSMKENGTKVTHELACEYVDHRKYIIDWVFKVAESFNLKFLTIQTAIFLIDSLVTNNNVSTGIYYQIAGISLLIASKFEESAPGPKFSHFSQYFPELEIKSLRKLETTILKKLNWNINILTPMHFVGIYIDIGVIFDFDYTKKNKKCLASSFHKYCEFFVDLCVQEYEFLVFNVEQIALGCIAASRRILELNTWPCEIQLLSKLKLSETCFEVIWKFFCKNFSKKSSLDNKENQ
jgi:Cyclin, N-terminal domain/Cyclin, C-terminal domain